MDSSIPPQPLQADLSAPEISSPPACPPEQGLSASSLTLRVVNSGDSAMAPLPSASLDRLPGYVRLKRKQAELAQLGIANPYFRVHDGFNADKLQIAGREYINYSGYNYLGLAGHPAVAAAAKLAIDRYGTSVSASRIASGEIPLHRDLERALAATLGTADCVAFVSGYGTNVTTLSHIFGSRDLIVHDALMHNSALLGARASGAQSLAFPHNDLNSLEILLAEHRLKYRRVVIVVEGVYSMDGDIPDLPRLIELKRKYSALLMIDEAHSIGVLGKRGRGIGEHYGVDRCDVDIWMGTLSKSLAACGGYVAGSAQLVEHLKYSAPGFIYSVGLTPPDTAAARAALDIMDREPERVKRLFERAGLFLRLARAAGLSTSAAGGSAVVPIVVGGSLRSIQLAQFMYERGINVQPAFYPVVPEGEARLRFFITADHTEKQIHATLDCLSEGLARTPADAEPSSFSPSEQSR